MTTCIICRFETELDDVVINGAAGRCVCLRCYSREVRDEHRMTPRLHRDLVEVLAEAE